MFALSPEQLLTKGNMAEQFVAQHIAFLSPKKELIPLYYWLRGGRSNAAEVNFIISQKSKLFPLEVKSGSSGKLRSLWQFAFEKEVKEVLRLDLSLRRQMKSKVSHTIVTPEGAHPIECDLVGVPLYAVENLVRIVEQIG